LRPVALRRLDDLRAPPLRLAEDLRPPRRDDLRAAALRFLPPPRLRPEDPDRDRFLPPLDRLDFLAAAMGKLRERGFVERIARFAHNNTARLSHRCNHWCDDARLSSKCARLTVSQNPEMTAVATSCPPLLSHSRWRLVHRLVGQLERAPVSRGHYQRLASLARGELRDRFHAVFGIHMN
jgi:hypothetical protein